MRRLALIGTWVAAALAAAAPSHALAQAADAQGSNIRTVAPMPSLAPMIKRVSPAVVSIGIQGSVREQGRNPLFDDPFFRRFFQRTSRCRRA